MDYTAYGEDIGNGIGLRTSAQGFGTANNPRQRYGLTDRDDATGLDHTPWRKNENQAGRWTSPDPYNGSMSLGNPQSFNRYSYVSGQPTNYVDPSGLMLAANPAPGKCVRYHYTNLATGEGFWGPWICNTSGNGGAGGGNNGGHGAQTDQIPPNCKAALKAKGLLKATERELRNEKSRTIDVDKIQNEDAEKYFGDEGKGMTVGAFFDGNGHDAITYHQGTTPGSAKYPNGQPIGRSGTYSRGGLASMSYNLRLHEAAHRAQGLSADLDKALAEKLGIDTNDKSASDAVSDYFNSGCDPHLLKKK